LDIFYPHPREVAGNLAIPPGFISYPNQFWNPITQQMEFPPESLIKTYRALKSRLARGGRSITRTHRKLIVTRNTLSSALSKSI
jgi:hypothetical protein